MRQGLPQSVRDALVRQGVGVDHPSADLLNAYAEHELAGGEQKQVTAHLAVCADCRETVFLASAAAPPQQQTAGHRVSRRWTSWAGWKWLAPTLAGAVIVSAALVSWRQLWRPKTPIRNDSVALEQRAPLAQLTAGNEAAEDAKLPTPPAKPTSATSNVTKQREESFGREAAPSNALKLETDKLSSALVLSKPADAKGEPLESAAADSAKEKKLDLAKDSPARQVAAAPVQAGGPAGPPLVQQSNTQVQSAQPAVSGQAAKANSPRAAPKSAPPQTLLAEADRDSGSQAGLFEVRKEKAVPQAHWRITDDGQLQRSLIPGEWVRMLPGESVLFRALAVVGSEVWAGGNDGALFQSRDGGNQWTKITLSANSAPERAAIVSIRFDTALQGKATTESGTIWTTSDGGSNWSKQ